jgi:uncharacterized membrane protein
MSDQEPDKKPESGSAPEAAPEPHHYPNPEKDKPAEKPLDPDVKDNRLMAALSYIGVLFLVPMLARNRSEYAIFHCRQGIMVFAIQAVLSFVTWIPAVGPFLYLLVLAISIIGFVQAWRGEWWEIPLLGKYAKMLKV